MDERSSHACVVAPGRGRRCARSRSSRRWRSPPRSRRARLRAGRTASAASTVEVPLDRSGRVPGKVSLHVEVLPAEPERGVMFLVAGGPGPGLGRRLRARRAGVRRRLPRPRPRLHARRGRQPRHRAIGPAALPDAEPGPPGRPGRRRGAARSTSARGATSTAPPTTPRISRRCAARSATGRSRCSASRTARSSCSPTRSRIPAASSGCCSTRSRFPRATTPSSPTSSRASRARWRGSARATPAAG